MNPPTHATTTGRAALGFLAALAASGLLSAAIQLVSATGESPADGALARGALSVGLGGVVVAAVLLIFAALPAWALCHRLGHRSWRTAAPLGGLIGGGAMVALMASSDEPEGAGGLATVFVIFGLFGALVGLIAWRVAYRRSLERPEDVF